MIVVTFDKESEYQWMRAIMASGELNCRMDGINALNKSLDTPLIPYNNTVTFRRSKTYENDLEGHILSSDKQKTKG